MYIPTVLHSYTHTFIHSYIPTFLHMYIPTVLHSFTHTLINSYIPTLLQSYNSTFLHSFTQTFQHCYIPTFLHCYIATFLHSYTLTFLHSYIPKFLNSYNLTFLHSYIPIFLHSYIPTLLHSYIPKFLHFNIPTFLHSHIPTFLHSYIHTFIHSYIPTRPSKCSKFYTSRNSGKLNLRQKERKICQNFNPNKITYLIYYTLQNSFQYKTIQASYIIKLRWVNLLQSYFSWNFYHKTTQNFDQKVVPQKNTVRLEQTNYANPGNFTPALLVILKTFRRSDSYIPIFLHSYIRTILKKK